MQGGFALLQLKCELLVFSLLAGGRFIFTQKEGIRSEIEPGLMNMDESKVGLIFKSNFGSHLSRLERGCREVDRGEDDTIRIVVGGTDKKNGDRGLSDTFCGDGPGDVMTVRSFVATQDQEIGFKVEGELAEFPEGVANENVVVDLPEEFDFGEDKRFELLLDPIAKNGDGGAGFRGFLVVFLKRDDMSDVEATLLPMRESGSLSQSGL